jgi:hypothetical protein
MRELAISVLFTQLFEISEPDRRGSLFWLFYLGFIKYMRVNVCGMPQQQQARVTTVYVTVLQVTAVKSATRTTEPQDAMCEPRSTFPLPILITPTTPHSSPSSGAGAIGQSAADVPSGLSLTPLKETIKKYTNQDRIIVVYSFFINILYTVKLQFTNLIRS